MEWIGRGNAPIIHPWTARYCVRLYYSVFYSLYGFLLLLPTKTFGRGNVYIYMEKIAPECVWGLWMMLLGAIGFYGVWRKGNTATIPGFIAFLLGTATMWWLAVTPFVSALAAGFMPAGAIDFGVAALAFTWCASSMTIRQTIKGNCDVGEAS